MKPVFLRHVALGDRQEAGQARLGGQQIVERVVAPLLGDTIADREEPPPVVVEKREVHRRDLSERRGGNCVVTGQEGRRTKDEGQRSGILKVEAFLYIGAAFVFHRWSFVHDGSQLGQGWRYMLFQIHRQQCLEVGEQAARLRRKPR